MSRPPTTPRVAAPSGAFSSRTGPATFSAAHPAGRGSHGVGGRGRLPAPQWAQRLGGLGPPEFEPLLLRHGDGGPCPARSPP